MEFPPIVSFVIGATTGVNVFKVIPGVAQHLFHEPISWEAGPNGLVLWPMGWVRNLVERLRLDAGPGGIITGAGPGAGLVIVNEASPYDSVGIHYVSVPGRPYHEETLRGRMDPFELYRESGGPNVEWFQPYNILRLVQERCPVMLEGNGPIVPWSDFLRLALGAGRGHDAIVHHDYGLSDLGKTHCARLARDTSLVNRLAPWPVLDEMTVTETESGVIVGEITHDTPAVIETLAEGRRGTAVVSAGTWEIIGLPTNAEPSRRAFDAGGAFEGRYGNTYLGVNVCAAGPTWKALKGSLTYEEAATLAATTGANHHCPIVDVTTMPMDANEGIAYLKKAVGSDRQGILLATLAMSVAYHCVEKIRKVEEIARTPVELVIAGGGFAANEFYQSQLRRFLGDIPLEVFSHPSETTAWAIAARALAAAGYAKTPAEALGILPSPPT